MELKVYVESSGGFHATQQGLRPAFADRLLRLDQVKQIVGLGKTLIYRLVGAGEFPAPYKPGGSVARWSENEVNAWLAACAAQRAQ